MVVNAAGLPTKTQNVSASALHSITGTLAINVSIAVFMELLFGSW